MDFSSNPLSADADLAAELQIDLKPALMENFPTYVIVTELFFEFVNRYFPRFKDCQTVEDAGRCPRPIEMEKPSP